MKQAQVLYLKFIFTNFQLKQHGDNLIIFWDANNVHFTKVKGMKTDTV